MPRLIVNVIEALKASPLLLAVLICNVAVIVGLLLILREIAHATKADRDTRNELLKQCMQQRTQ